MDFSASKQIICFTSIAGTFNKNLTIYNRMYYTDEVALSKYKLMCTTLLLRSSFSHFFTCRASENIIPKCTANITRMRTTL